METLINSHLWVFFMAIGSFISTSFLFSPFSLYKKAGLGNIINKYL